MVADKDVTPQLDLKEIFKESFPTPQGRFFHPVVASSAVKNIMAILNNTGELTHAPGPNGLPGGYPVRLSAKGCEVIIPEGLTLQEAIKINEEAGKADGIEKIDDDGTVTIRDEQYTIMKEMLNYDCKKFRLEESASRAKELSHKFKEFVEKYKSIK